jgi:hypothetical protein
MARGEGPWANPTGALREDEATGENRLSVPRPVVGDVAGGLVAELGPGVAVPGVPELNSAHRGHFRLVSVMKTMYINKESIDEKAVIYVLM